MFFIIKPTAKVVQFHNMENTTYMVFLQSGFIIFYRFSGKGMVLVIIFFILVNNCDLFSGLTGILITIYFFTGIDNFRFRNNN